MTSKTISAENLGPISALNFSLDSPGVTVLVAPNGSGKTILLEAVQAAARGEGKLPLRDRTRRGMVSAFGAQITIGGTCRHTGEFEVTHLEGRFDLAGLVDPRIKTPSAADKARIKALVSLTGAEANVNLFRTHPAFDDFDTVVTEGSIVTDDLVEMAAKIKADYDAAALVRERTADREGGMASALIPPSTLDLDEEDDPAVLQAAYNEARDEVTRLEQQAKLANEGRQRVMAANDSLKSLGADELTTERQTLVEAMNLAVKLKDQHIASIAELRLQIAELERRNVDHVATIDAGTKRLTTIDRQLALVAEATKALGEAVVEFPDDDDIADCAAELSRCEKALEQGVLIRAAKADAAKGQAHRLASKLAREKADKYRDAGKATDEVLSSCIKCPQLRVESDGKSARLVTDITDRGKSIAFHDLSDGEKWTIAIDIGADQVGAGGLLVISQIGWEGIDGANRLEIHQHAVNRGVYILTAEAASDPTASKEIIPTPMAHVEPTAVTEPAASPVVAPEPVAETPKPTPPAKAKAPPATDIPF
jgi:energy-coupling factor transporter ATP-binding protein EcfA2